MTKSYADGLARAAEIADLWRDHVNGAHTVAGNFARSIRTEIAAIGQDGGGEETPPDERDMKCPACGTLMVAEATMLLCLADVQRERDRAWNEACDKIASLLKSCIGVCEYKRWRNCITAALIKIKSLRKPEQAKPKELGNG